MEKKIIAMLLSFIGVISLARAGDDINQLLQQKFQAKFGKTTSVKWKKVQDVYIGQFMLNNEFMECYFNDHAELLGTGRYFTSNKIDPKTKISINAKFPGWFIQQSYEYTAYNESSQFMFIITNIKYTAIVKANAEGEIEVIREDKNKLPGEAQTTELSKNMHPRIQSIM